MTAKNGCPMKSVRARVNCVNYQRLYYHVGIDGIEIFCRDDEYNSEEGDGADDGENADVIGVDTGRRTGKVDRINRRNFETSAEYFIRFKEGLI